MPAECSWCQHPVARDGDTCSFLCYSSWWAWWLATRNQDSIHTRLLLVSGMRAPFDIEEQPWYIQHATGAET